MLLRDKIAIVTGAAQGIGRAIAKMYCEQGATVILLDMQKDKVEEAAAEIQKATGSRTAAYAVDITKKSEIEAVVQRIIKVDWTRSIWRPEANPDDKSPYSLADLERRLRDKLKDARHRNKDDAWIAESMARAAWQYVSQPGESVWPMTTESGVDHPAPFPIELPSGRILIYTSPGDLVLDPFMGAGATAVAAVRTGRHFVGYEISEEYCALAQKRVAEGRLVDW